MKRLLALALLVGCGDFLLVRDGATVMATPVEAVPLQNVERLEYYALSGVLGLHVSSAEGRTLVEYGELTERPEALHALRSSLARLAGVDLLRLDSPDERLAYVLNLYNVNVLVGVLEERLRDPLFSTVAVDDFVFFDVPRVQVGSTVLTLDQLEHGVIRGDTDRLASLSEEERALFESWTHALWEGGVVDARIHMGLNCSARSCPDLPMAVFHGASVNEQLDEATTQFVDDATRGAGPDGVSQLFTWFQEDFDASSGSVRAFVEAYRSGGVADVDFDQSLTYDWALNGR